MKKIIIALAIISITKTLSPMDQPPITEQAIVPKKQSYPAGPIDRAVLRRYAELYGYDRLFKLVRIFIFKINEPKNLFEILLPLKLAGPKLSKMVYEMRNDILYGRISINIQNPLNQYPAAIDEHTCFATEKDGSHSLWTHFYDKDDLMAVINELIHER